MHKIMMGASTATGPLSLKKYRMSEGKQHTALVCDGEVDTDDEEPPTPRILDSQSGPVGGTNVFFLQPESQSENNDFTRNDSLCDETTPTTEQYCALTDVNNTSESKNNMNIEDLQTEPNGNNGQSVSSFKSMTESSDIEVIEEKDSSDSIEVLEYDSANSHGNTQTKTYADMCESIRKIQMSDNKMTGKNSDTRQAVPETSQKQVTDNLICTTSTTDSKPIETSPPIANGNAHRPNDLSLPRPVKLDCRQCDSDNEVFEDDMIRSFKDTDRLIQAVASTPLQTQGTVIQDGDMVAFVAEDLQEKIISSPASRTDSIVSSRYGSRTPSSRSMSSLSSSSASGWSGISTSGMSRSPSVLTQSPEDMPPIDPRAIFDLEVNARKVAESLDNMMRNLKVHLHKMSSYTTASLCAYQEGVDHTCDSVDATIKSMYALMAKCEELSKTMLPVYEISEQIKEIKRLLELFEGQLVKED